MLAKPESGTPDRNKLTTKEKDNNFVFYTNKYMKLIIELQRIIRRPD